MSMDKLRRPDNKYRPDVRWWLAEGFHTDQTLQKEIADLDEAGFGAVEFLALEEPGADSKLYGWGSEEWVHDSHTIVEETTRRDMGVSMTSGTNWSNANLINITPDDKAAAKELDYAVETVPAGTSRSGAILRSVLTMPGVTKQELEAVVAMRVVGQREKTPLLDKDSGIVLTDQVKDDTLEWTAPADGDYLLFFFWIHGTGQTAAPAMSTAYTINYIDRHGVEAFIDYWESTVLTPQLRANVEKNGRAMMYMDSLELGTFGKGGQFWGYHFREEFQKRRGYDLTPYLPFVLKQEGMMQPVFIYHYTCDDALFLEKLYNDLYQTMTDMYMENMLKPMQEWLHSHNMTLRAEISYGLPFEISQPGKYVDGIETESLEFASQIESYRNLAGPAHIYGRTYSSETGATLHNYMMGLDFYTQIIYSQFAAGVTKTVLHGYSSIRGSEGSTYWPGHEGMWPIFSERFGSRQPAYCHYHDWMAMLARYQMLLRQGKPRMDVGILRLDYNFNNSLSFTGPGKDEVDTYEHHLMRGNEGLYWKDMTLQNNGYTWDYFAPQILEEDFVDVKDGLLLPDGPGYRALVVYQDMMPLSSAKKLLELAQKGLPVVFVNGVNETIRPFGISKTHAKAACMTPFNDGLDEQLRATVAAIKALPNVREVDVQADTCKALCELGVAPIAAFDRANRNILTHTQRDGERLYVYVYNMQYTQREPFAFELKMDGVGRPSRIDCWNATVEDVACYRVEDGRTVLPITLAPGEAAMYVIDLGGECGTHAVAAHAPVRMHEGRLQVLAPAAGSYAVTLSDGSVHTVKAPTVAQDIPLPLWDLTVESWSAGDKREIVEDRGLGIVTHEVYYETKKTPLHAGVTALLPWKDIPAVGPEVSGVGRYTTHVTMPKNYGQNNVAVLHIGGTNACTVAVYVNGRKGPAVDMDARCADISALLVPGDNELVVEVSSSLNNRLLADGYYDRVSAASMALAASANNANMDMMGDEGAPAPEAAPAAAPAAAEGDEEGAGINSMADMFNIRTTVKDYGMVGETYLALYTAVDL